MTKAAWHEVCERISALWPARKKIPEATEEAWYGELGKRADFDVTMLALTRLAAESDKAPGLSALSSAVRELGGAKKRPAEADEVSEEERERYARIAKDWIFINRCRWHPAVRGLLLGLLENEADPGDMRLALLDEIRVNKVEPREPAPLGPRGGDLTLIGETIGAVL